MEISKILWPTDLSGNAEYALPYIESLIEKYQSEVHVLYVIEDIAHHGSWYGEFDQAHIDKLTKWESRKAEERLEELCSRHMKGCPLYIKHTVVGDPAREILNLSAEEKVDMIVMAMKGKKGNFRYGSTAEKVSRNSHVPVMIVPAH